ncbi:phage tail protein [Enterobacter hormaechei]|uniref:phage tail protein n=1 Tax=Enterobacter hormaechei TaxID=158836 RepID=UPI002A74C399|nr:phage tail protein [Enterobacter hormaechei]MDY3572312.1 phage tail protein [Enterobacter hormaechei]
MNINALSLLKANALEQVENYLDQLPPLLMWGDFLFQLSTLAYSRLTLSDSWTWASQGRIGRADLVQYTGKKQPTLRFDCEQYETLVNTSLLSTVLGQNGLMNGASEDPVEHLRLQANLKTPLMLVAGTGKVMGFWVLTEINQVMDEFRPDSKAKHQNITLTLQYYDSTLSDENPVPEDESLGFKDKGAKIREAINKMKETLEGGI